MMKYNRRNFLQLTGTAATSVLLSSMESFASPYMPVQSAAGYNIKVLATNWGFDGSMDAFCAKAKSDGYDGIEHWWPYNNTLNQDELFAALKKYNLEVGFLCGASESTAVEHIQSFKKKLDEAVAKTKQKPLYINLHSGRDYFNFEDNSKIVEYTLQINKQTGIPVYHETHRGRMMFATTTTNQFLKKYTDLKLTLDISHWCNVHESMLADQQDNVAAALQRTGHIHARIGYQEGPQVADPRAPEWEYAVKAHFEWWDKIVEQKKKAGEQLTFLTEFGPPLYMQTLPYTLQPLSNQWEINVHMMKLLRKRYGI
jgi:sugar phosphate isomerase/epimerase